MAAELVDLEAARRRVRGRREADQARRRIAARFPAPLPPEPAWPDVDLATELLGWPGDDWPRME